VDTTKQRWIRDDAARAAILNRARVALPGSGQSPPVSGLTPPVLTRPAPRIPGDTEAEIAQLLAEIGRLSGMTRRLASRDELPVALAGMVRGEGVQRATLWTTPELDELGIAGLLTDLGVVIISPQADRQSLAACDLGVTGVDAALPETGTLLLRSSPERARLVSLLPRVHLAILQPAALRADLHQALADVKGEGHFVLITGPSRTADIEMTLTLGVHGPKSLYVWVVE